MKNALMKNKRIIAFIMCLIMVVSLLPVSTMAGFAMESKDIIDITEEEKIEDIVDKAKEEETAIDSEDETEEIADEQKETIEEAEADENETDTEIQPEKIIFTTEEEKFLGKVADLPVEKIDVTGSQYTLKTYTDTEPLYYITGKYNEDVDENYYYGNKIFRNRTAGDAQFNILLDNVDWKGAPLEEMLVFENVMAGTTTNYCIFLKGDSVLASNKTDIGPIITKGKGNINITFYILGENASLTLLGGTVYGKTHGGISSTCKGEVDYKLSAHIMVGDIDSNDGEGLAATSKIVVDDEQYNAADIASVLKKAIEDEANTVALNLVRKKNLYELKLEDAVPVLEDVDRLAEGEVIFITENLEFPKRFEKWKVTDSEGNEVKGVIDEDELTSKVAKLTMPGKDIVVTAVYNVHEHQILVKERIPPTCVNNGTVETYACADPECPKHNGVYAGTGRGYIWYNTRELEICNKENCTLHHHDGGGAYENDPNAIPKLGHSNYYYVEDGDKLIAYCQVCGERAVVRLEGSRLVAGPRAVVSFNSNTTQDAWLDLADFYAGSWRLNNYKVLYYPLDDDGIVIGDPVEAKDLESTPDMHYGIEFIVGDKAIRSHFYTPKTGEFKVDSNIFEEGPCEHAKNGSNTQKIIVNFRGATCEEPAKYVYGCAICQKNNKPVLYEGSDKTYTYGSPLGHLYKDGVCQRFFCNKVKINECSKLKIDIPDLEYTGGELVPKPNVTFDGELLKEGVDYTFIINSPQKELGTYGIWLTFMNRFVGSGYREYREWKIVKPHGLFCEYEIPDQVYTGSEIRVDIGNVYKDGELLVEGVDYKLTYKNNINVASKDATLNGEIVAPSVTINGIGDYSGSNTLYFTIKPAKLKKNIIHPVAYKYTGKDIKIKQEVVEGNKKLVQGKDYVISTSRDAKDAITTLKDVGNYKLYAVGIGNYENYEEFECSITVNDVLADKVTIAKIPDQKYDGGRLIKPAVKVTYNKKDVSDCFEVDYSNNSAIGTATVYVSAKIGSGFAGVKKATFKIVGSNLNGLKIGADGKGKLPEYIYSGKINEPKPDLYIGKKMLARHEDYIPIYSNNINAGTATLTIKGTGAYLGIKKYTYKIKPYNAQLDEKGCITIENEEAISSVPYEKGGACPKPVIKMGGTTLVEKKDYTLSYVNNKTIADAGAKKPPKVIITFKGNFSGKRQLTFSITQKDINKCNVTIEGKAVVDKDNAWKQTVATIVDTNGKKLVAGTDYNKKFGYYSDVECQNEIKDLRLGADTTVYVKITGIEKYAGSYCVGSYRISKRSIVNAKAEIDDQIVTQREICPTADEITVTIGSAKLRPGVDYDVVMGSYKNNINVGTATLTIYGKGDYYGRLNVNYKIVGKKLLWWTL